MKEPTEESDPMTTAEAPRLTRQSPEAEPDYRELSWPAVAGCAFALGTLASFPFAVAGNPSAPAAIIYGVIPALGMVCAVKGLLAIRRSPEDYTGGGLAWAALVVNAVFALAGWGAMTYVYLNEVPDGFQRIAYQMLKPDPQTQDLPKTALELDGKPVFIKGYMYPGSQSFGIREFILCRDNGDCCFGGQPPLTDMVYIRLKDSDGMDFREGVLTRVWGRFRVEVGTRTSGGLPLPDAIPAVVYHLDDAEAL